MSIPYNLSPLATHEGLPPGYTRVEYISPTQSGQNIQTDIFDILPYTVVVDVSYPDSGVFFGWRTTYLNESGAVSKFNDQGVIITGSGSNRVIENVGSTFRGVVTTQAFLADRHLHSFEPATGKYSIDGVAQNNVYMSTRRYEPDYVVPIAFMARNLCYSDGTSRKIEGTRVGSKHYSWQILEGSKVRHNWVPALDPTGEPCMFDLVSKQPFRNAGSGQFVAGVGTVAQLTALLRNLPATGGELTLSLPAEANTPEVAEQLQACHDTKGWTLTVQEYRPAAAATYSLRRVRSVVWCRKEQTELGGYVDNFGTRWQIDRCAAIFGPHGQDPTAYGYTPFDSVEQAAEAWELTPYIEPEEQTVSTAEL